MHKLVKKYGWGDSISLPKSNFSYTNPLLNNTFNTSSIRDAKFMDYLNSLKSDALTIPTSQSLGANNLFDSDFLSYFGYLNSLKKSNATGDVLPDKNYNESQYTKKPSTENFFIKFAPGIGQALDIFKGTSITSKGEDIAGIGADVLIGTGNPYAMALGLATKGALTLSSNLGQETNKLNKLSNEDKAVLGNSYTGTLDAFSKAENVVGNKYSLFNRKGLNEANESIAAANAQKPALDKVITNSQKQLEKQAGNVGMMQVRNNQRMYGGPSSNLILAKEGTKIKEPVFTISETFKVTEEEVPEFKTGGKMNVIPEGAFHCRKNNMEVEGITKKGIPVVLNEKGGEIEQQAEIERNEIIFNKEVTTKLEELYKDGSDEAAIKAGKLLVEEILYNTDDRTGLIDSIEYHQQGGSIGIPQQHLYIDPENGKVIDLGSAYGQKGFEYYTKLADEYKKPENPHWLNWAKQTVNPADYRNRDYIRENLPEGYNIDDNGIITDKDGNVYVTHRYGWAKEGNNLPSYKHLEGVAPISVKWRKEHGNLPTNATFYPIYSPHNRYIEQKPVYTITSEIAKQEKEKANKEYIEKNSKDYYRVVYFPERVNYRGYDIMSIYNGDGSIYESPDEKFNLQFRVQPTNGKNFYVSKNKFLQSVKNQLGFNYLNFGYGKASHNGGNFEDFYVDVDAKDLEKFKEYYKQIMEDRVRTKNLSPDEVYNFSTNDGGVEHFTSKVTPEEAEQKSQVRFQYLDSQGNPVFYQQGGTLDSGSKENFVKPTYEDWYNSIPEEAKANNYDYELAFSDLPLEELLNHAKDPSKYHLRSVGKENKEGLIPFLKLGKLTENPELNGEFEWYYSEDPEAIEFRNNYDVIYKDGRYFYKSKQSK